MHWALYMSSSFVYALWMSPLCWIMNYLYCIPVPFLYFVVNNISLTYKVCRFVKIFELRLSIQYLCVYIFFFNPSFPHLMPDSVKPLECHWLIAQETIVCRPVDPRRGHGRQLWFQTKRWLQLRPFFNGIVCFELRQKSSSISNKIYLVYELRFNFDLSFFFLYYYIEWFETQQFCKEGLWVKRIMQV